MKGIQKTILILSLLLLALPAVSCEVCERQQPKFLQGITHGTGPDSQWDYAIVAVTAIIVLATLFYTIKWLINPGEKSKQHIKMFILNND
ncbi:hypothetical protein D9M68_868080 [compost metagenome]